MADTLLHSELTERIIAAVFRVHNVLGEGFAEKVYENALGLEMSRAGFRVEQQKPIEVYYEGASVGNYVADIVVNELVLLEIKAGRAFTSAHEAQLLNYLRATPIEVGLLVNFGQKAEFKRMVFANERKRSR